MACPVPFAVPISGIRGEHSLLIAYFPRAVSQSFTDGVVETTEPIKGTPARRVRQAIGIEDVAVLAVDLQNEASRTGSPEVSDDRSICCVIDSARIPALGLGSVLRVPELFQAGKFIRLCLHHAGQSGP